MNTEDTIVAISTPKGTGGIGIVRLSGKSALSIADKMFSTSKGETPSTFKGFTVHYGHVVDRPKEKKSDNAEIIDEALLTVMRSPKSYTREDVVEISCHGGIVVLKRILSLALDLGARLADPGEFTKRAFLNGRIDLTQAEAVLDIIRSKTDAFLKVSTHQLKGELTLKLEAIRERLMDVYTECEAIVNFPEDDTGFFNKEKILKSLDDAKEKTEHLIKSSEQGRILREGIKIVICGKPNVGKSSLLNVLLKHPRAIVSEVSGTTRDTIEEMAQINDIPFELVDTAGILEPRDLIEEEAVKRTNISIQNADLILLMFDGSLPFSPIDEGFICNVKDRNVIVVVNKCDLDNRIEDKKIRKFFPEEKIMRISALKNIAIKELKDTVTDHVLKGKTLDNENIMISNVRHIQSLKVCDSGLSGAIDCINQKLSPEFISEEIKKAIDALDTITGRSIESDLLDKIFSEFCIGK
jgi:tRNA modification GTPase